MLFLLLSSSSGSSLDPLQGDGRMPQPPLTLPGSLLKRAWARTIFPNVGAGKPGTQAARSYSSLQPDRDTDKGPRQTHSLDIARDKFMHISISPAQKMRTVISRQERAFPTWFQELC